MGKGKGGVIYLIDYIRLYWACVSRFHGMGRDAGDKKRIMEGLERQRGRKARVGRVTFR